MRLFTSLLSWKSHNLFTARATFTVREETWWQSGFEGDTRLGPRLSLKMASSGLYIADPYRYKLSSYCRYYKP
jgi:hypothetical protein